jgi:hypothetical protein
MMGFPVSTTFCPRTSPSVPTSGEDGKKSAKTPWTSASDATRLRLTVHGDGADRVLSQVHGDLEDEAVLKALDLESVEDGGEIIGVELDLWAAHKASVSKGSLQYDRNRVPGGGRT